MQSTHSMKHILSRACLLASIAIVGTAIVACGSTPKPIADPATTAGHLATVDELDFRVIPTQTWSELDKSHSHDVIVHWPDGHVTTGLAKHTENLMALFAWAPDTRIASHTVSLGQGDWTTVVATMEGTFTRSMRFGRPDVIAPTGKPYRIQLVTVGHWKNGVMDEKYLFWDNQSFDRQIGLAP